MLILISFLVQNLFVEHLNRNCPKLGVNHRNLENPQKFVIIYYEEVYPVFSPE